MPSDLDNDMMSGMLSGLEQDRAAVLATVQRLLRARLLEGELTPDERLQAQLLLREVERDLPPPAGN